jgi:hypothetical protein
VNLLRTSSRRSRRLLAAVLPLVVLRLLVPAGFMPMADAGGLTLALCPGETASGAAVLSAHAGHHMHDAQHGGGHAPAAEHHTPCLFAASSAPAVAPGAALIGAPTAPGRVGRRPAAARDFIPASLKRAQSARAPPVPLLTA